LKVTSQLSRGFCGLAATFWVCLVADKSNGFVRLHEYNKFENTTGDCVARH
jgi:hypothetical protein